MAASVEPPIEWVPGGRHWWVARVLIPGAVIVLLILFLVGELGYSLFWPAGSFPFTLVVSFAGLAVEFFFLFAIPSVRRIGISPTSLIVDVGVRKLRYPWNEVNQITRTRVDRFRWNQVSSVSRTRISVGAGAWVNWFSLSPEQGDRLARFLRIP